MILYIISNSLIERMHSARLRHHLKKWTLQPWQRDSHETRAWFIGNEFSKNSLSSRLAFTLLESGNSTKKFVSRFNNWPYRTDSPCVLRLVQIGSTLRHLFRLLFVWFSSSNEMVIVNPKSSVEKYFDAWFLS